MVHPRVPARAQPGRFLLAALFVAVAVAVGGLVIVSTVASPRSTTPTGDPPVLAGQQLWGSCAAGFYARLEDKVVLTSSAHCAAEGTTALDPDGRTVRGVFGPGAVLEPCPHERHTCRPSDMNFLVVAPDRVPWGRLNMIDMGRGGTRVIEPGTAPLSCTDIEIGDAVEINGRDIHRSGAVTEKGEYLHDPAADGDFFPCIVAATDIDVGVGDSGGAVLVRGLPAGATSRSIGGILGFTPLAEGLDALGLELCTTPDCGLDPPTGGVLDRSRLSGNLVLGAFIDSTLDGGQGPARRLGDLRQRGRIGLVDHDQGRCHGFGEQRCHRHHPSTRCA